MINTLPTDTNVHGRKSYVISNASNILRSSPNTPSMVPFSLKNGIPTESWRGFDPGFAGCDTGRFNQAFYPCGLSQVESASNLETRILPPAFPNAARWSDDQETWKRIYPHSIGRFLEGFEKLRKAQDIFLLEMFWQLVM